MPIYEARNDILQYAEAYKPFDLAGAVESAMRTSAEMTRSQTEIQKAQQDMVLEAQLAPVKLEESRLKVQQMAREKEVFDLTHSAEQLRAELELDKMRKTSEKDLLIEKADSMKKGMELKSKVSDLSDKIAEKQSRLADMTSQDQDFNNHDMVLGGSSLDMVQRTLVRNERTGFQKIGGFFDDMLPDAYVKSRKKAVESNWIPEVQQEVDHFLMANNVNPDDREAKINDQVVLQNISSLNKRIVASANNPSELIRATGELKKYLSVNFGNVDTSKKKSLIDATRMSEQNKLIQEINQLNIARQIQLGKGFGTETESVTSGPQGETRRMVSTRPASIPGGAMVKNLDPDTSRALLNLAGGDANKARELAVQRGFNLK